MQLLLILVKEVVHTDDAVDKDDARANGDDELHRKHEQDTEYRTTSEKLDQDDPQQERNKCDQPDGPDELRERECFSEQLLSIKFPGGGEEHSGGSHSLYLQIQKQYIFCSHVEAGHTLTPTTDSATGST